MTLLTPEQKIDEIFDCFELDILAFQSYGDSVFMIKKSKDEKIKQLLSLLEEEKEKAIQVFCADIMHKVDFKFSCGSDTIIMPWEDIARPIIYRYGQALKQPKEKS